VARGGNPARAKNGGDVEEQHIPEAHGFWQLRFRIERGSREDWHRVTWERKKFVLDSEDYIWKS